MRAFAQARLDWGAKLRIYEGFARELLDAS